MGVWFGRVPIWSQPLRLFGYLYRGRCLQRLHSRVFWTICIFLRLLIPLGSLQIVC
jgi:hypothetical protein